MPADRDALEAFAAGFDARGDVNAARRRGDQLRRRRRLVTSLGACVLVLAMIGGIAIATDRATDNSQTHITDNPTDPYSDLGVDPWEQLPPPPVAVDDGTAIVPFFDDYVVWGSNGGREGAVLNRTTSGRIEWKAMAPAPDELGVGPATAVATETTIIVITGDPQSDNAQAALYKPASGTWQMLANPPFRRGAAMTAGWSGTEAIFYGTGAADCGAGPSGYAYNPTTDTWRVLPEPPFGSRAGALAVWTGPAMNVTPKYGQLVVLGGSSCADDSDAPLRDGARYDPESDSWTAIAEASGGGQPIQLAVARGWVVVQDDRCADECTSAMRLDMASGQWDDLGTNGPNAPHGWVEYQIGIATWNTTGSGAMLDPERGWSDDGNWATGLGWSESPDLPAAVVTGIDDIRFVGGSQVLALGSGQLWRYPGDAYVAKQMEPARAMDALSGYARYPQMFSIDDVPLADEVTFAFGDEVFGTRDRSELDDESSWEFDFPDGTLEGSFSLLEILRGQEPRWAGVGAGARCASPSPPGAEGLRQAGMFGDLNGPCENWWSVDVYVDRDGQIRLIRYDRWVE